MVFVTLCDFVFFLNVSNPFSAHIVKPAHPALGRRGLKADSHIYFSNSFSLPGSERSGGVAGQRWTLRTHRLPGARSDPVQGGCREGAVGGGKTSGDPQGDGERKERQGEKDPRVGEVRKYLIHQPFFYKKVGFPPVVYVSFPLKLTRCLSPLSLLFSASHFPSTQPVSNWICMSVCLSLCVCALITSQNSLGLPSSAFSAVTKSSPSPRCLSAANGGAGVGLPGHVSGPSLPLPVSALSDHLHDKTHFACRKGRIWEHCYYNLHVEKSLEPNKDWSVWNSLKFRPNCKSWWSIIITTWHHHTYILSCFPLAFQPFPHGTELGLLTNDHHQRVVALARFTPSLCCTRSSHSALAGSKKIGFSFALTCAKCEQRAFQSSGTAARRAKQLLKSL